MDWLEIETALQTVCTDESGIPFHWGAQSSAFRANAFGRLEVPGVRRVGEDEIRLTEDVGGTFFEQRQFGQRVMRVQFTVESNSQRLATSARAYAEKLRSRLRLNEVHEALAAVGLSLAESDEVFSQDFEDEEGRLVSFAAFEARFNARAYEQGDNINIIDEVVVEGEVVDAGAPLSDPGRPVNFTVDSTP